MRSPSSTKSSALGRHSFPATGASPCPTSARLPRRRQKAVEVAKRLDVHKTCVVAGEVTKGLSIEAQNQAVIDSLKAAADIVTPADVTIILEPLNVLVDHPDQLIVTSAHAAKVLTAVGSPHVKMLFDCYHQQISEGNLTGNIRKYHDLIGYYQIADHPGRHEPGTGEVNYAHVFRVIHEVGYKGAIGMELSPKSDPEAAFQAVRACDRACARANRARKIAVVFKAGRWYIEYGCSTTCPRPLTSRTGSFRSTQPKGANRQ